MKDLLVKILSCTDNEAEEIIKNSETYYWLCKKDYATLYESPQANLSSIGEELRKKNNPLGLLVTDENIKICMKRAGSH